MAALNRTFNFDDLLEMKDAGLVAASDAAQVDSKDLILDTGGGFTQGNLILDVTAIEIASNDEIYTIILEGSNSATFANGIVPLAVALLGAQEVIVGGTDTDSTTGRYIIPFRNERDGTVYRYLRVYTVVAGAIATGGGINYSAFLSKTIGG
jgi:hypothetical protein